MQAARITVKAMSTGRPLKIIDDEVPSVTSPTCDHTPFWLASLAHLSEPLSTHLPHLSVQVAKKFRASLDNGVEKVIASHNQTLLPLPGSLASCIA